jgi:hypothetical protein
MEISPPEAHLAPPDDGIAARASSAEFEQAAGACEFAVLVWSLPDGVVALANDAASTLFDAPLLRLLGTKNIDLLGPRAGVEGAFAALSSRAVENLRAERHIRTNGWSKWTERSRPWPSTSRWVSSDGSVAIRRRRGAISRRSRWAPPTWTGGSKP